MATKVKTKSPIRESFQKAADGPYKKTALALLDKFNLTSTDPKLTEARIRYFETAISKGTDLSRLPKDFENKSVAGLLASAAKLPDKQARGWSGITSLSEKDRKNFEKAARDRQGNVWAGLFPKDHSGDLIVHLNGQEAQSASHKIESFIARHNKAAQAAFRKAKKSDATAKGINPDAYAKAGRTIDQRRIRLDPEDKNKLQTFDPAKKEWMPGPRLAKYLQEQYEWKLYDIVQMNTERAPSPVNPAAATGYSFTDFLNHEQQDTDLLFHEGKLRVLISADPQKIGEMSTGQRWNSCMANDGLNYRFVANDISQGTLVAYLVHEDDVEARYPFMRQLIKPFNGRGNKQIYVPAIVYGGYGAKNSIASDALQMTTVNFVDEFNKGKTGIFRMNGSLYSDGQATVINVENSWPDQDIADALLSYQYGSIQEWMTEMRHSRVDLALNRKGQHGEDPADTIRKLKNKIERVLRNEDIEVGLPRMFFREQTRVQVGASAAPRDIQRVAQSDPDVSARTKAFQALRQGDVKEWQKNKGSIGREMTDNLHYFAVLFAKPQDGINTSKEMMLVLLDNLKPGYDEFDSTGYSHESLSVFSFVMERITPHPDTLTPAELRDFCERATNILYETTSARRKRYTYDSDSWMGGGANAVPEYSFGPDAIEQDIAVHWCRLMQELQKRDPLSATKLAEKIRNLYTEHLDYTDQHKLAAEILEQNTKVTELSKSPQPA